MQAFSRVKTLIGEDKLNILQNSHVAVFGIGGVGGYVVEALVRSGIGEITIIDSDMVTESNLNRQIIATVDNLGKDKVWAMKQRILSINPTVKVHGVKLFYLPETADEIDFSQFDYIVDAIDTVTAKLELISRAKANNVPIISCMGTGAKTDPALLKITDIKKTKVCPLARVMRRELNNRGINQLKIIYSEEEPIKTIEEQTEKGKRVPPSMIFVPATAGLMLAKEVVFDLVEKK